MINYCKSLLLYIIPKKALTLLAGCLANVENPWLKNLLIRYFIQRFQVDMREAQEELIENYKSFNLFFIRHLKPGSRSIADADIVSPVDGYISAIGNIKSGQLIQAKGHNYTVTELLASGDETAKQFANGFYTTLYLSPKDYHRVHMPITGTRQEMIYIPGALFPVKPIATQYIPRLFARNERLVIFFETAVGRLAVVLVGATLVGRIGTAWHGDLARGRKKVRFEYSCDSNDQIDKGEEIGYFKMGSTVVLLFADSNSITWQQNLIPGAKIQLGESFGVIK